MAGIGVALSGGGHRAALFGLGVLLYLADAGKNKEVTSIASVSGGSLTNGYVAQSRSYRSSSKEQFEQVATQLARQIASKGTLWASPLTWLYLLLLLLVAAALVGVWLTGLELPLGLPSLELPFWLRAVLFSVGLLIFGLLAQLRGAVCARAFARALYSPQRRPTLLAEINTELDHVFCATDLHRGEHVYFSGGFVCGYAFGFGQPGDVPLHTVVHASAAYPGGFPPVWLPTRRHRFLEAQDDDGARADSMALVDGGVYDNMADQWGQGITRRKKRWGQLAEELRGPDELIVVNSSAPMRWGEVGKLRIPFLGELTTLRRDMNVLYDNTTTPRRRLLLEVFTAAMRSGQGLRGTVVQISQSPLDVPTSFAQGPVEDELAQRAHTVLAALRGTEPEWSETVKATSSVKTTLSRVPSPQAELLLWHGYVLAMANTHVILDYPLLPLPELTRFARYVRGASGR